MSTRLFGKFALGATVGVALTVAATQAWNVTAAPGDDDSTFVPVAPCRLFDTRPGEVPANGPKAPIQGKTFRTQQVTGNVGNCVGIPSDAVAVAMNVTIANPTGPSFLTVYPSNASRSAGSNLNWVAGQAPTPNLVTVKLSPDGKVNFYNHNGTVDVIADVAGYYTKSSLEEIQQRLSAVVTGGGGVVAYDSATDEIAYPTASDVVNGEIAATERLSVTLEAPSAGKVSVVAHATAKSGGNLSSRLVCQITNDPAATAIDVNEVLGIASPASGGSQPSLGTNRVFDVAAGTNTFDLMCAGTGQAPITIHYRSMTATFTSTG